MKIKRTLQQRANQVQPSEELFNKIRMDIYEKENEEKMNHKKFSFKNKKLLITAVLCIAVTSITAIGAGLGGAWIGHTNIKYKTFPSETKVQEDVGFVPKYTAELPGGFAYKYGGFGTSELTDEVQNSLTKVKHITLGYERDTDKQQVVLGAEQIEEQFLNYQGCEVIETYNSIPLYYSEQTYKFVPPSYELTEEDKVAVELGAMEISVGSSEVSIEQYQYIAWYQNGISYNISGFDGNFEVGEMLEMAQYVIDQE